MAEILKKGYLLKCPQKAYAFKKWNSRWFVLYANNIRGRVRLEYYDSEKGWQMEKGKRVIPLVTCVSIKPVWHKDYNHVIEIVTSGKTYFLAAGSKDEEKGWFRSLCKAVFGSANRNSIVHLMDRPDPMDLGYHSLDRSAEIADATAQATSSYPNSPDVTQRNKSSLENLSSQIDASSASSVDVRSGSQAQLRRAIASFGSEMSSLVSYESGFDDASSLASTIPDGTSNYQVTVRSTIASQNAKMSGSYTLQVTPLNLFLLDSTTHTVVADWPLQYLKRYGRGRTKFSFEAGDKCPAGCGVFTFNTTEGDAIFHQVDNYARKISALQNPSDMRDKRISLPDGFRPLHPSTKRIHHSDGKLVKEASALGEMFPMASSFDSTDGDMSSLNAAHSTPNIGKPAFPSQGRNTNSLFVIKDIEIDKSPNSQRTNRSLSVTENQLHSRTESELSEEVVNNSCTSTASSQDFVEAVEQLSQSCHSLLVNTDTTAPTTITLPKTSQIVIPYSKRVEIPLDDLDSQDSLSSNDLTPRQEEQTLTNKDWSIQEQSRKTTVEHISLGNNDTSDKSGITIVKTVSVTTPPMESMQCGDFSRQIDLDDGTRSRSSLTPLSRSIDSLSPLPPDQPAMTRSRSASPVDKITSDSVSRHNSQQKDEKSSKCERKMRKNKSKKGTMRQQSFEHPPSEKPHINKPMSFSAYDYGDYDYTYENEPKENEKGQGRRWPWKRTLSVLKRVEHYEQITKRAEQTTRTFHLWRQRSMRRNDKDK